MYTIKTALVALTTILYISFGLSESIRTQQKEQIKSKLKEHVQRHSFQQETSRTKDSLWNTANGWNYWEVITTQVPSELLFELYGEIILDELLEGPVSFSESVDFFFTGFFKEFSGQSLRTSFRENVTLDATGSPIEGPITRVDSLCFSDTLITIAITYPSGSSNIRGGIILFTSSGQPLLLRVKVSPTTIDEIHYTYENETLTEILLREIELLEDGTTISEILQKAYRIQYDEQGNLKALLASDEELADDLSLIKSEKVDSISYVCNSENQLIEQVTYSLGTEITPLKKRTFTYNTEKRLQNRVVFSWNSTDKSWFHSVDDDSTHFAYDNSGNQKQISKYTFQDGTAMLSRSSTYSYDNLGNLTDELKYDFDNAEPSLFDSSTYTYNADNNLERMSFTYESSFAPLVTVISYKQNKPQSILEITGESKEYYECTWEDITPVIHSQNVSHKRAFSSMQIGNKLHLTGLSEKEYKLELFNPMGKRVFTESMKVQESVASIVLPNLSTGLYLLKASSGKEDCSEKLRIK